MNIVALLFSIAAFCFAVAVFLSWSKYRRDQPTVEQLLRERADLCANWPRGENGYPLFQENVDALRKD